MAANINQTFMTLKGFAEHSHNLHKLCFTDEDIEVEKT